MKKILIDDDLHAQVKAVAALNKEGIREYVERLLRGSVLRLVDIPTTYNPRYDCNPNETDDEAWDRPINDPRNQL